MQAPADPAPAPDTDSDSDDGPPPRGTPGSAVFSIIGSSVDPVKMLPPPPHLTRPGSMLVRRPIASMTLRSGSRQVSYAGPQPLQEWASVPHPDAHARAPALLSPVASVDNHNLAWAPEPGGAQGSGRLRSSRGGQQAALPLGQRPGSVEVRHEPAAGQPPAEAGAATRSRPRHSERGDGGTPVGEGMQHDGAAHDAAAQGVPGAARGVQVTLPPPTRPAGSRPTSEAGVELEVVGSGNGHGNRPPQAAAGDIEAGLLPTTASAVPEAHPGRSGMSGPAAPVMAAPVAADGMTRQDSLGSSLEDFRW